MAKVRYGTSSYKSVRMFFFLLKFFTASACVSIAGLATILTFGFVDKRG